MKTISNLKTNQCPNKNDERFLLVASQLCKLYKISQYQNINPYMYLHGKSAYLLGDNFSCRVEFLESNFKNIVRIPINSTYEDSCESDNEDIANSIHEVNKLCRLYCESLFYINKNNMMQHISNEYSSHSKQNKVSLKIEIGDIIKFVFEPRKKYTNMKKTILVQNNINKISNYFRLEKGEVRMDSSLCFCEAINNNLFSNIVKIEIDSIRRFIRLSSSENNVKIKLIIKF